MGNNFSKSKFIAIAMAALFITIIIIPYSYEKMILIYLMYLLIGMFTGAYFINKTTGNSSVARSAFFIAYLTTILFETMILLGGGFFDDWKPWSNIILRNYFLESALSNIITGAKLLSNLLIIFGVLATRVMVNLIIQTPIVWFILKLDRKHSTPFKKVFYSVFITSIVAVFTFALLTLCMTITRTL